LIITALVAVVAIQVIANAWKHDENGDARAVVRGPSVAVIPFESFGTQPNLEFVARGLTLEVVTSLTRFSDLFVYGPEVDKAASQRAHSGPVSPVTDASYVLSGSVYSTSEMVRVSAILIDAQTSRSVWSANFNRDLSTASLLSIQSDIAEQVANAVGQPYGAVFNLTAEEVAAKPIASLRSYECVIRFRQRWRDYDQREYADMRDCLEQTIKADPGYARAYASLALLYMDTDRFGFGRELVTVDPMQEAFELSRRALELNPNESDGYLALSMIYWFSRDFDASVVAAKRGLAADPHNADLMAELGFRYAFMGKWDLSRPLIAEAFARNPALPSGYRLANFLYYYMQGDFHSALHEALQVKARYVHYGHLALAAVYGKLGDGEKAKAPLAELLEIDPHYGDHVEADLARRAVSPAIIHELVDGLVKAGLQVPPPPISN
jgi:adenylate cyclase